MKFTKQFTGRSLRILFFVIIGIFYAILTSVNPLPISNILLWLLVLWLFRSTINEANKLTYKIILIIFVSLLLGYVITGVKSAFYIAEFNQVRLGSDEIDLLPNNWSSDTISVLLSYTTWYKKVSFAFNQEYFYYSFGTASMSLGIIFTKTIKMIEILGLAIFAGLRFKK